MWKNIAGVVFCIFVLVALFASFFYFGGPVLLIILGGLTLIVSHLGAYLMGEKRSEKRAERLIKTGAGIVTSAVSRNDQYDAVKIKAMSNLLQEAVKANGSRLPLLGAGGAPGALEFEDGVFEELEG